MPGISALPRIGDGHHLELAPYSTFRARATADAPLRALLAGRPCPSPSLGDPRLFPTWQERWRQIPASKHEAAVRTLTDRDDISGRLKEIRPPTIIFHRLEDTGIPPSDGEFLHKTLPGSVRFVPVAGATHAVNLSHPEAVNPPLLEFLRAYA